MENILKQFALTFGRDGIDIGNIKVEASSIEISEPELNGELKEFYSLLNFEELTIGGEQFLEIFPLGKLQEAQNGWMYVTDSKTGGISEDTVNWNKDWIVFGDRNGDAIFCKQDTANNPVYGSIQKTRNLLLAPTVIAFFQILTDCMMVEKTIFILIHKQLIFLLKLSILMPYKK